MMRVATVFSGIGAIEHANERMGIEHEIIFACDNSNIDWTEKCTKTKEMIHLLGFLDSQGISYPGLSELLSCWNNSCQVDSPLEIEHIISVSSFADENDAKSLSNLAIVCSHCNRKSANQGNSVRKNLTGVQEKAREYALEYELRNQNLTGVQIAAKIHLNFLKDKDHSDSHLADCTVEKSELPNLKEVLLHCIFSINNPELRKQAVDLLYQSRGKTPFVEQSYLANYDVPEGHFHKDVTFLDGTPYRDQVDLFVGGSPCQSFSFVGHQGGFDDARGTLFYDFVRLVNEIKPKMFIWENVKGVYTHDKGKTWEVITKCFDNTNYTWHHAVLNSKDYGIPQHRQRVFVVGFLEGGDEFSFPEKTELKMTMQDFLEDQVAGKYFLNTKGVDFVTWDKNHRKQYTQIDGEIMLCQKANQQFNWHGDFVFVEENKGQHLVDEKHFLSQKVERYVLASGTKGFSSKPETDLEIARPLLATLFKNHRAGVDNYVTTEGRLRMLTPKECLRLMGFCDSFERVVSNLQLYRQAGNSIVVDVLIAIMAQAIPVLASKDKSFSKLQLRAKRIKELFNELPELQIQHSDLERIVTVISN